MFYKIVLPVSGFFPVFLYYSECAGPLLLKHNYCNINVGRAFKFL